MKEKLVSAIITTHNRLEYLKKAINSVKKQTYKNIELIIVDDNSDDGTKEYCKNLDGIKYIYISEEEHKNGNYARNIGLNNSSGDFVAFLDDDDEWLPEKIEKQVKLIESNDKLGAVYTATIMEINNGMFKYDNYVNESLRGNCKKKCLYNIITSTSAVLFTKEALNKIGGFDENVNYWQDVEMMMRICQDYEIDYINEPLVIYREIFKDKKRLSNNITGYMDSLEYINKKYEIEINSLSKEEMKKRRLLIYNDIAIRYDKVGDKKNKRKYLFKVFKMKPTLKGFIKVILNFTWVDKYKLKMKLKKQ